MNIINELASWSVLGIWAFGAIYLLCWLGNRASDQAYRLYRNAHSWVVVTRAVREYHERRDTATPEQ